MAHVAYMNVYDNTSLKGLGRYARAILFPESQSAFHSLSLQNKPTTTPRGHSLPSPESSEDENDKDDSPKSKKALRRRKDVLVESSRAERNLVVVLRQTLQVEKFTFGSSPNSDVILKHDREDKDCCWINYVHCQIYPDPDRDALWLYNLSTIDFSVQHLENPRPSCRVAPSRATALECGDTQLTLGNGLKFKIRVLPRFQEESDYTWSLISCLAKVPKAKDAQKKQSRVEKETIPSQSTEVGLRRRIVWPEKIGQTHFTEVYKVDRGNRQVMAAKVYRRHDLKQAADMWKNEVEVLKSINHPSIVKLLESDARKLILWLDYIPGQPLSQCIDEQYMSVLTESASHQIWVDISGAIEHIHRQKILHHDVKPSNIILKQDKSGVVLCDFGCAVRDWPPRRERLYSGGSPSYIPPEYLLRQRSDPSDIWAFAVTMLFVFKFIPLPRGNWRIANLLNDAPEDKRPQNETFEANQPHGASRERNSSKEDMLNWLSLIEAAKDKVPDRLYLLREMLHLDPQARITASGLVKELQCLPMTVQRQPQLLPLE